MEGNPPVTLWVFDKAYQRKGPIPAPVYVEWLGIWDAADALVFTVEADNPRLGHLRTPGARVVATLMRPGYTEPRVLVSGPVTEVVGTGVGHLPTRTFTVQDDFDDVFYGVVGWPVPAAAITAQNTSEYHTITGPIETVVRTAVTANAPRQGVPVTVAASAGLGPTATIKFRMHKLADRLFPKVAQLGLGVRVFQDPEESVRRLITWLPVTRKELTEESGVILPGAEMHVQAPAATRVVVAAGGDGTARVFREYIDAAAETKWGVSRSLTVDARDVATTDPALATILQQRADAALAENGEKTSLKIELTESDAWQYGVAFELGDMVPVRLAGEVTPVTDRIEEVLLTWTTGSDGGLVITPRLGGFEESPDDRLFKLVSKALKVTRNLEVTK